MNRRRTSARVLLFNASGRVLLIQFVVAREGRELAFWATPGGAVEGDETPAAAAGRELREELGVAPDLSGPVHQTQSEFEHEGQRVHNTDIFFVAFLGDLHATLTGTSHEEITAMRTLRWWSASEIEISRDTFFPPELAQLVAHFGRAPDEPR